MVSSACGIKWFCCCCCLCCYSGCCFISFLTLCTWKITWINFNDAFAHLVEIRASLKKRRYLRHTLKVCMVRCVCANMQNMEMEWIEHTHTHIHSPAKEFSQPKLHDISILNESKRKNWTQTKNMFPGSIEWTTICLGSELWVNRSKSRTRRSTGSQKMKRKSGSARAQMESGKTKFFKYVLQIVSNTIVYTHTHLACIAIEISRCHVDGSIASTRHSGRMKRLMGRHRIRGGRRKRVREGAAGRPTKTWINIICVIYQHTSYHERMPHCVCVANSIHKHRI